VGRPGSIFAGDEGQRAIRPGSGAQESDQPEFAKFGLGPRQKWNYCTATANSLFRANSKLAVRKTAWTFGPRLTRFLATVREPASWLQPERDLRPCGGPYVALTAGGAFPSDGKTIAVAEALARVMPVMPQSQVCCRCIRFRPFEMAPKYADATYSLNRLSTRELGALMRSTSLPP
jgi:hypothetical protein